ncbi:hypothetical protein F5X98DRAFT_389659 [Xylaria grammica]|nr:hypothetical protein F5X98DRAFT_389659 [Xylaria grammica]
MCRNAAGTNHSAAEICVETNNFHQVIQHFDDKGGIINKKTTRFSIDCGICKGKKLAIVNPDFDKPSDDTHQKYVVLPRCGHAFCSTCISEWINMHKDRTTCPSCRALVYGRECMIMLVNFGSTIKNIGTQDGEIVEIRRILLERGRGKSCEGCPRERGIDELASFFSPRGGWQGPGSRPFPIWEPYLVRFPRIRPVELNWVEQRICGGRIVEDVPLHTLAGAVQSELYEARRRFANWLNSSNQLIRDYILHSFNLELRRRIAAYAHDELEEALNRISMEEAFGLD